MAAASSADLRSLLPATPVTAPAGSLCQRDGVRMAVIIPTLRNQWVLYCNDSVLATRRQLLQLRPCVSNTRFLRFSNNIGSSCIKITSLQLRFFAMVLRTFDIYGAILNNTHRVLITRFFAP